MSSIPRPSNLPGLDRIIRWLDRRRREETAVLGMAALGFGVAGVVTTLITGAVIFGMLMVAGRLFPGSSMVQMLIHPPVPRLTLAVSGVLLLFAWHARRIACTRRMQASHRVDDMGDAVGVTGGFLLDVVLLAPWILFEAFALGLRTWRLLTLDIHRCSQMFHVLATRGGRVSFASLAALLEGGSPDAIFTMLRQIDGVVFLFEEPRGISLTEDLRRELRELLGMGAAGASFQQDFEPAGQDPLTDDPWRILGIQPGASQEQIKAAYRRTMKRCHPDRFASMGENMVKLAEEQAKQVNIAHRKLREPPSC